MKAPSKETWRRLKRTFWQVLAGGAVSATAITVFAESVSDLIKVAITGSAALLATFAQNVLEDQPAVPDNRANPPGE